MYVNIKDRIIEIARYIMYILIVIYTHDELYLQKKISYNIVVFLKNSTKHMLITMFLHTQIANFTTFPSTSNVLTRVNLKRK